MGRKLAWLPRIISVGLALMGALLFPSAAFSQVENFPYNAQIPAGWTDTGGSGWVVDNTFASQGTYSLRSKSINHGETAGIEVTINVPRPGTVSFDYRVESEAGWDYLQFYIDGVLQNQWSGFAGWSS